MDVLLPSDFFIVDDPRRNGDIDPDTGTAPHVPPAFVTGLRDWRSAAATSRRHPAQAADADWHPL